MKLRWILISALLLTANTSQSEEDKNSWMLGGAIQYETGHYVGKHDFVGGLPYFSYEGKYVVISSTDGPALHIYQYDNKDWLKATLSALLTVRSKPEFGDDPIMQGLSRKLAIETGILGKLEHEPFYLEAKVLGDLSGQYGGAETTLAVGLQSLVGFLFVDAKIGAIRRSSGLNNYLFGVKSTEVTEERGYFDPSSSTSGIAGITAYVPLSEKIIVLADVTYEDIGVMDDSPLVDSSDNTTYSLGFIYAF